MQWNNETLHQVFAPIGVHRIKKFLSPKIIQRTFVFGCLQQKENMSRWHIDLLTHWKTIVISQRLQILKCLIRFGKKFGPYQPRLSIWMWQALRNRLPTKINLVSKGCKIEHWCFMCINQQETLVHILLSYPPVRLAWEKALPMSNILLAQGSFIDKWFYSQKSTSILSHGWSLILLVYLDHQKQKFHSIGSDSSTMLLLVDENST